MKSKYSAQNWYWRRGSGIVSVVSVMRYTCNRRSVRCVMISDQTERHLKQTDLL